MNTSKPLEGWFPAKILNAVEGTSRLGNNKIILELEILDAATAGRTIRAHIPTVSSPRALEVVEQLKKALNIETTDPLFDFPALQGKVVRINVTPFEFADGGKIDSVVGFAPVEAQSEK